MTTTTTKTRVVFASLVGIPTYSGERLWLIKFANESDQRDAESGTPVIIKPEWKEPEKS